MYKCCLPGCKFDSERHSQYLNHLSDCHSSNKQLRCNYNLTCAHTYKSIKKLKQHCEIHTNSNHVVQLVNYPVGCPDKLCGSVTFQSIADLIRHFRKNHHTKHKT